MGCTESRSASGGKRQSTRKGSTVAGHEPRRSASASMGPPPPLQLDIAQDRKEEAEQQDRARTAGGRNPLEANSLSTSDHRNRGPKSEAEKRAAAAQRAMEHAWEVAQRQSSAAAPKPSEIDPILRGGRRAGGDGSSPLPYPPYEQHHTHRNHNSSHGTSVSVNSFTTPGGQRGTASGGVDSIVVIPPSGSLAGHFGDGSDVDSISLPSGSGSLASGSNSSEVYPFQMPNWLSQQPPTMVDLTGGAPPSNDGLGHPQTTRGGGGGMQLPRSRSGSVNTEPPSFYGIPPQASHSQQSLVQFFESSGETSRGGGGGGAGDPNGSAMRITSATPTAETSQQAEGYSGDKPQQPTSLVFRNVAPTGPCIGGNSCRLIPPPLGTTPPSGAGAGTGVGGNSATHSRGSGASRRAMLLDASPTMEGSSSGSTLIPSPSMLPELSPTVLFPPPQHHQIGETHQQVAVTDQQQRQQQQQQDLSRCSSPNAPNSAAVKLNYSIVSDGPSRRSSTSISNHSHSGSLTLSAGGGGGGVMGVGEKSSSYVDYDTPLSTAEGSPETSFITA